VGHNTTRLKLLRGRHSYCSLYGHFLLRHYLILSKAGDGSHDSTRIDHLDPEAFSAHPHYRRGHWPLIHSVSFYSEANIIASARTASGVFIISRKTGAVLWHLAAPIVCQQHRAHQINAAGDILIPDNGVFRPEISVPFSQAIIVSLDKQIRWEYKDTTTGGLGLFTPFMGSAQKLWGGNVLIRGAATGRIIEVSQGGEVVWEFVPQLQDYRAVMSKDEFEKMERIGFANQSNAIFERTSIGLRTSGTLGQ